MAITGILRTKKDDRDLSSGARRQAGDGEEVDQISIGQQKKQSSLCR